MLIKHCRLLFMMAIAASLVLSACKTTSESIVKSSPQVPLPQAPGLVLPSDPSQKDFNYSLDNEALWKSPAGEFSDACGAEAAAWNKMVETEYPKTGDYYDARKLPPPQSRWDTVLGILKKPHTSIPTFLYPHRDGRKKYTAEEIPDKETFAKALAFMKKVGSLGVLQGTKSGRTRDKVIHASGSVAKISFIPNQAVVDSPGFPYTGITKYGAPCGYIRAGLAVSNAHHPFTPGIALKFFINAYPNGNPANRYPETDENPQSTNIVAMYSLDGQPTTNFFEHDFSNVIAYPTRPEMKLGATYFTASLIAMGAKPGTEEADPTIMSASEMGKYLANGQRETTVHSPVRMTFRPTDAARNLYASGGAKADVRQILLRFPVGQTLYDVFATDDRTPQGDPGLHVGWIVLRTSFRASQYADQLLHFRHVKPMQHPRFN